MRRFKADVAVLGLVLATGCAGTIKNMNEVTAADYAPKPAPGKALVVFLRPSGMAYGVQSSVFEVKGQQPVLAGILAAKTKVAYQADPGKALFMVVGESGDFLGAELEAGKTYFAAVTPRMGAWKARFSLAPVHAADLAGAEFAGWLADSRWVEIGPQSTAWASQNAGSVKEKYDAYYPRWLEKAAADRPALLPTDGR